MKKVLFFLFFVCSLSLHAQNIRVYNLDIAPHNAAAMVALFKDYHGTQNLYPTSEAILQRVRFQNGVTHRLLFTGDPKNWGASDTRDADKWNAYIRGSRALRRGPATGSYTARSYHWKSGNRDRYHFGQTWFVKANNPQQYMEAFKKFAEAVAPILGDRMMGVGTIGMGDLDGANIYTVIYAESMNDLDVVLDKIMNSKAFKEFAKTNGGREILKSFGTEDVLRYTGE